jgi:hypothetical protein
MPEQQNDKPQASNKFFEVMKDKYARVFAGKEGQEVLADILKSAGIDKDNFDRDPYENAMRCGLRKLGLHIKTMAEPPSKEKKAEKAKR